MKSLTHDLRVLFATFGGTVVPANTPTVCALVSPVTKTLKAPDSRRPTPGVGTDRLCTCPCLWRGLASARPAKLSSPSCFHSEESVRAGRPVLETDLAGPRWRLSPPPSTKSCVCLLSE